MKVLLSAYACEPNKGSEPGVGWHWCMELAKLGHEVWVLTRENNRENIEAELAKHATIPNLNFIYYDPPKWAGWWKRGPQIGFVNAYYALWQWGAYQYAKKLHQQYNFDVVHHLTFGVFRQPSFMGGLGIPFILGPLGGGERAPLSLRKSYSLRGHILDFLRDVLNFLSRFDPVLQQTFDKAVRIYVKTPETAKAIPQRHHSKIRQLIEIGINMEGRKLGVLPEMKPFKILYVGNYFSLKGMQIGIQAFAQLAQNNADSQLTMVGRGPRESDWKRLAKSLGIENRMYWHEWVTQQELAEIYRSHHVLFFPSLHDSSGNVLLEAMSYGLPVVCLQLGGPGVIVDSTCGTVIPVERLNEAQVAKKLCEALQTLIQDHEMLQKLGVGAYERAYHFSWQKAVTMVYEEDFKPEQLP